MVGILSEPVIVTKLNNFAQSYRPRHLEERIRRSHTKQLEQQLETVSRTRRVLVKGKSEHADAISGSTSNSPRRPDDGNSSLAPILSELAEQFTDHHKPSSTTTSPNKDASSTNPGGNVPKVESHSKLHPTTDLLVTAHHIEPEVRPVTPADTKKEFTHTLHHSPSGHHNATDHLNHNLEHHHHHQHHQPEPTVLQKTLSNILLDADVDSKHAGNTKVDENSVNEILVLGKQLSMQHQSDGESSDVSAFPGGRKGAEIHKAIQQDHELEKGLEKVTENS